MCDGFPYLALLLEFEFVYLPEHGVVSGSRFPVSVHLHVDTKFSNDVLVPFNPFLTCFFYFAYSVDITQLPDSGCDCDEAQASHNHAA